MSVSAQTMDDETSPATLDGHAAAIEVVGRILLVEEQAHVLRVIRLNLERCGYLVDIALSAEHALRHVHACCYDALVITSDLPDMTSGRLCEQTQLILNDRPDLQSPLILVGRDKSTEWMDEVDCCESMGRPVSLKLILARLEKYFDACASPVAECQ